MDQEGPLFLGGGVRAILPLHEARTVGGVRQGLFWTAWLDRGLFQESRLVNRHKGPLTA